MLATKTLRSSGRKPNGRVARPCPNWDGWSHTLYFRGRVVKRFTRTAPNMEAILEAFQRQGWKRRIDNPLPQVRGCNSKRQLHETIQNFNRCLDCSLIRFRGDGFGKGVCWEPA